MITAVLTLTLLKSRANELPFSNSTLRRIIRLTVETNSLTAGVAVVSLILFFAVPHHSTFAIAPTAIIGKLYTNCLVAVLNNRQFHRRLNSTHSVAGETIIPRDIVRLGQTDNMPLGQAQVKVSVVVDTDTDYIDFEAMRLDQLEEVGVRKKGSNTTI